MMRLWVTTRRACSFLSEIGTQLVSCHAWTAARRIVEAAESTRVHIAICSGGGDAAVAEVVVGGPAPSRVGWVCAGKAVIAYSALRAALSSGLDLDDDLRDVLPHRATCPRLTLREIFTYRSGLVRGGDGDLVPCFDEPELLRERDWDPTTDAIYWNSGWDLIPSLVSTLIGAPYETFLREEILRSEFGMESSELDPDLSDRYCSAELAAGSGIRRVMSSTEFATSLGGPLADLARFYQSVSVALDAGPDSRAAAATLLTGDNDGPSFFGRGISPDLRWSLGFPRGLAAQGFAIADPASIGAVGGVLTLTGRGLEYAWVAAAGAFPSTGSGFAVAVQGLRPLPDDRYSRMVEAIEADLREMVGP